MKAAINVEGQSIPLKHMRRSKKGAEVRGARVHIPKVGTVYVQVYEEAPKPKLVSEPMALLVEIVKAMSKDIEDLKRTNNHVTVPV